MAIWQLVAKNLFHQFPPRFPTGQLPPYSPLYEHRRLSWPDFLTNSTTWYLYCNGLSRNFSGQQTGHTVTGEGYDFLCTTFGTQRWANLLTFGIQMKMGLLVSRGHLTFGFLVPKCVNLHLDLYHLVVWAANQFSECFCPLSRLPSIFFFPICQPCDCTNQPQNTWHQRTHVNDKIITKE